MRKGKRFLITIEEEKHQKLSDLAWQNRNSLNEYIRNLLTEHIEKQEQSNEKEN